MLTLFVALIAIVALVTALLAHFKNATFADEADAEYVVLKDYVENELDKLRAKVEKPQ